jgi:hypothetical protein
MAFRLRNNLSIPHTKLLNEKFIELQNKIKPYYSRKLKPYEYNIMYFRVSHISDPVPHVSQGFNSVAGKSEKVSQKVCQRS